MSKLTLAPTYFDIEILKDGESFSPEPRYINRSNGYTRMKDEQGVELFYVSNDKKFDPRLTESQPIYCVPGVQFKFSADWSIDKNSAEFDTSDKASNFTYRISKNNLVWDFGDGHTSTEYEPIHAFEQPGEYSISVTLYDVDGLPRRNVYKYMLVIRNYFNDEVIWDSNRLRDIGIEYGIVSIPLNIKLKKTVSWQNIDTLDTITMYASGSNSLPGVQKNYMENKHAHMQKTWRFVEDPLNPVPVEQTNLPGTPINVRTDASSMFFPAYSNSSSSQFKTQPTHMELLVDNSLNGEFETTTIGVSGVKDMYFIDDSAKNYLSRDVVPVFLFTALSSTGEYGEDIESPVDVMPVKMTYQPATHMRISTNGMRSFVLNETMFMGGEYTLNIAALSEYGIILKSDYEQFFLQTTFGELKPYEVNISITDNTTGDVIPTDQTPREITIDTPGCGNFIITPKQTSADATLTAHVKLVDPPYSPIDTSIYVLTDMHDARARFLIPGFADPDNPLGATFGTLADNTYVAAIDSPTLTSKLSSTDITHSCFAVAVHPEQNVVYAGNETNDTLFKFNRSGKIINDGLPIYIPRLICESGVLNQTKFNYYSRSGDSILDYMYGNLAEFPDQFEASASSGCDRFELNIDDKIALSPSSLSIDGTGDVWVTLIDGVMTVKISPIQSGGHRVTAIAIPQAIDALHEPNIDQGFGKKTESGEMLWMPSKVVADMKNDIWVSYTNSENIKLIKYSGRPSLDDAGEIQFQMNQLCEITFPEHTHLDDMIIDPYNNLWVTDATHLTTDVNDSNEEIVTSNGGVYHVLSDANSGHVTDLIDREQVYHLTTYNTSVNSVAQTSFDKPTAMAVDLTDVLYVATNGNSIVRIDVVTHKADFIFAAGKSWTDIDNDKASLRGSYNKRRGKVSAIDALGCNSDNKLLVMNNAEKILYSYTCPSIREVEPGEEFDLYNYELEGVVKDFNDDELVHTLQGAGDWTGMRWIQKYLKIYPANRVMTGHVDLRVANSSDDDVVIQNENHDASQAIIDYTLQDTINTKDNLLYWFFKQIVGDINSDVETLGKVIYSKIANFVPNNVDIDTCTANNLKSIATQMGCDIKTYNYTYPGSIQRLIDILSIKYSALFGSRSQTGFQFSKNGYANNFNHGRNIGPNPIDDVKKYRVKIGSRIVARELYNNNHTLIEPMAIAGEESHVDYSTLHGGLSAYLLGDYDVIDPRTGKPTGRNWNWGLSHPNDESVFLYYDFFEYVEDSTYELENFTQLAGVIDWNNNQTTVNESSTLDQWTTNGGLVDMIIDKKLRKGLKLLS